MSSRSFASASSQYLRKVNMDNGIKSFAGWAKVTASTPAQVIMYTENKPFFGAVNWTFDVTVFNFKLTATVTNGSTTLQTATTTTTTPINTWFHFCGTVDATNITVYLNGGGKATNTHTISNQFGRRHAVASTYTGGTYFDGTIAQVSAWNTVLKDNDVLSLASGLRADEVQNTSLMYRFDLDNDDVAQFGGLGATGGTIKWGTRNSPTFSTDDPNIYPLTGILI